MYCSSCGTQNNEGAPACAGCGAPLTSSQLPSQRRGGSGPSSGMLVGLAVGCAVLIGVVMVLGVLSAIAIPAFMKFQRRSKTTEAVMNIRKLHDAAISYYVSDQPAAAGGGAVSRFPASVAATPSRPYCADGSDGDRFVPSGVDWDDPTWKALAFEIRDPHYYRYDFDSRGQGPNAAFTARANGDLDCDGQPSTFERVGTVDAEGEVRPGAGVYIDNELE